jgi:hypothetical protein
LWFQATVLGQLCWFDCEIFGLSSSTAQIDSLERVFVLDSRSLRWRSSMKLLEISGLKLRTRFRTCTFGYHYAVNPFSFFASLSANCSTQKPLLTLLMDLPCTISSDAQIHNSEIIAEDGAGKESGTGEIAALVASKVCSTVLQFLLLPKKALIFSRCTSSFFIFRALPGHSANLTCISLGPMQPVVSARLFPTFFIVPTCSRPCAMVLTL